MMTDEEYLAKHKAFENRVIGYAKTDHLLRTIAKLNIIDIEQFRYAWHELNRMSDEAHYSWSQIRESYYENMRSTRGYV